MNCDWEWYSVYHKQFLDASVPQVLRKYLTSGKTRVFMDVGCGEGNLLYSLEREHLLDDMDVIAVDISEKRVEAVRRISQDFQCYVDDACKLTYIEDNSVDVLASLQVIEHVPNDEEMIIQLHRVLSEGGIAYVTTVFKKRRARYIYRNADGESVIDPTHVREYKDDNLISMFERHGFEVVENRKQRVLKPVLGFVILGRLSADRHLLTKHALLRTIRMLKLPVPGYYHWEILARKKESG